MFCMECKTNIVVPEPGHSSVIVEQNAQEDDSESSETFFELPEIISEKKEKKPPLPPPVPGMEAASSAPVSPTLVPPPLPGSALEITPPRPISPGALQDEDIIPLSLGNIDEELEVLSYIYEEKHRSKSNVHSPPLLPPAPAEENVRRRKHWRRWIQRLKFLLLLLFLIGGGTAVWLYLTRPGPDLRLDVLKQIEQRHFNAAVDARSQEIKAADIRQRAAELWLKAGEQIDNYIITFNEPEASVVGSATEKRLHTAASDIQEVCKNALTDEEEGQKTFLQSLLCKKETAFWEAEKTRLQEQIRQFPNNRNPVTMPVFETETETETAQNTAATESLRFDSDWTENRFVFFEFPTSSDSDAAEDTPEDGTENDKDSMPFFAVPDRVYHNYGSQSLRVSILKKEPALIRFPKEGNGEYRLQSNLQNARSVVFSLRFPERRSRILFGDTTETGQIGEYRIRFRNKTGCVELIADAPRYCEAVFYDARGQFLVIEVPLDGNEFWKRENAYTVTETEDDTEGREDGDASFFRQIDSIEFSFVPRSGGCTFWLDGMMVSDKVSREPYALTLSERRQETVREEERKFYQRKREEISVTNGTARPGGVSASGELLSEQTGELLRWVLQTAKGRAVLKSDGRTIVLNSDSPVPAFLDGVSVEEIDLNGFYQLNDEQLEQLGSRKDVKCLELSRTGLTDERLLKIAGMDALEKLVLSENKLTFAGLPFIRTLKKLQELHLDGLKVNAQGTTSGIEGLSSLTNLKILSAARSEIDSSDLNYLMTLADLETLDISATKIGDNGTAILRVFPELQTLNLSGTRITNAGLIPLQGLKKLRQLRLDGTSVDEACLDGIGKISSLETISVQKTSISREGVRKVLGSVWLGRFRM